MSAGPRAHCARSGIDRILNGGFQVHANFSLARGIVSLLCATAGLLALSAPPAEAVTTETFHNRGKLASLTSVVVEGCVETRTYLDAGLDATSGSVNVTYAQFRSGCDGSLTTVFGSSQEATLTFGPNLSSAHLVATLELYRSGEYLGTMSIDNMWTANSSAVRDRFAEGDVVPGDSVYKRQFKGTTRQADVTGTITLPPQSDYSYGNAYLWDVADYYVFITH